MIEVGEWHLTRLPIAGTVNVRMDGYDNTTYGNAFADVYDDWYREISDIDATVADLLEWAGAGPVLELGVGTGRLAVPLAEAGRTRELRVVGLDASSAMLARLSERDVDRLVEAIEGDMIRDIPAGQFSLVLIAYNTLFNLTGDDQQAACFEAVARQLVSGGCFVVEAFVPDDPPQRGDAVSVRSIAVDRVVLSVTSHHPDSQSAEGQFVEFTEQGGVRLRPWAIRYANPVQLDRFAATAGLRLEQRWQQFGRIPFTDDSARHVSVYRKE